MPNNEEFIFQTSGSSGVAKTVKKSYRALLAEASDLAKFLKIPSDTIFVSTVSPEHMYGTTFTVMLPKVLGCKVDEERVFYPEDMKDYEKFVFVSTPSFLERLAKYKFKFKHKPLLILSAGAKLDDKVFEYLEGISQRVVEIYGSTEAGVMGFRQSAKDNFKFFDNVKYESGKLKSPYFDEPEIVLSDDLEFFDNGCFRVKGRNDRIVKIQEKRISLDNAEKLLNSSDLIEKSYCLDLDDKLCAAVVLTDEGRKILEEKGKLELIKILKSANLFENSDVTVRCKKWRFLYDLPVNKRGKVDGERIREIFSTNVTYPYVIESCVNAESAEFELIFPHESNFFKGHFTNFPILPGVVQLFFAKEFIKDAFNLDLVPQKVKKVKFSSIIRPDEKVCLSLKKTDKAIEYQFTNGEKVFSSGNFVL